jgi:DNA polymerase
VLNFYDFEVTKYDWMVVIINPITHEDYTIINDPDEFSKYYEKHKNEIWIGYNNRHYDQYIAQGILCGFDPWKINDWIINKNQPGYLFSKQLNKFPMINYDVQLLGKSLKQLEGFQGHNIHESEIDFTINRNMTEAELKIMAKYCHNDVEETINVWLQCKSDFDAQMELVKMFELPLSYMGKSKAQIVAEILGCNKTKFDDEWDISILDCLNLSEKRWLTVKKKKKTVEKVYMSPAEWFNCEKYQDYDFYFECEVAGVTHVFGWGGIHGAKEKYHYKCDKDHYMIHVDVESYYPRFMIFHNLLTRAATKPKRFRDTYEFRMELKHAGKKKEQAPLKIVINSGYGISKDPKSKAYDPRRANEICINGQLLLLDLIEHLQKNVPSFELIQSNTDGLIIKIHKNDFELTDDVCYEWESRCNMVLAFDYITEIWQKDVNNYIFTEPDGNIGKKGAYVKDLSPIDNDLPIINKALCDKMLKGVPVEQTINDCDDYIMFQKICKLSNKFDAVEHNGKRYTNKCYRVYASINDTDNSVRRVKGRSYNKFGNTPEHAYIENGNVLDMKIPKKLDKQWYIDLANTRLEQFGIGGQYGRTI